MTLLILTGPNHWRVWLVVLLGATALTGLALLRAYPPGDVTISRAVHGFRTSELEPLSQAIFHLGLFPFYQVIALAIAAVLLWRRKPLTALFISLIIFARGGAFLIKELVERPRPSPEVLELTESATGFSFPSGHVIGAVLLVGFLWYLVREVIHERQLRPTIDRRLRLSVDIGAASIVLLMGLQRIYTGAHWPTDVFAGYLWGGVILYVLIQAYRTCAMCLLEGRLPGPLWLTRGVRLQRSRS